jgi:RNA polymerase sigma-70 factor (ECF subfamily)
LVQEAYSRFLKTDVESIEDQRGWFVTVVSRLCMDHLRSARVRRESAIGPWLPEPLVLSGRTGADPAEVVTFDESVRMALLIVLERLTPPERATFVLHDVFEFSFEEIAPIIERTPDACRQLASRARSRVHNDTGVPRQPVNKAELQSVAQAFIDACAKGDLRSLIQVLDPAVVGWTDVGDQPATAPQLVRGIGEVAEGVIRFFGPNSAIRLFIAEVNGEPGVVAGLRGRPFAVIVLNVHDGRILAFNAIADPAKLKHVNIPAD